MVKVPHTSCLRRSGVTLIEVLVAIFVMGLGLITLLALFPLGALTMAQAIRDERCASAAQNATALAIIKDLRHDPQVSALFSNPQLGNQYVNAPNNGPSYPVYVDPMGYISYLAPQNQSLGGIIPRIVPSYVTAKTDALRFFSLLDTIQFDKQGLPNYVNPPLFERDNQYSWAYLLRRPLQANPEIVTLTVVVYSNRPLSLNGSFQGGEASYSATFTPSDNMVSIPNGTAPNLRIGDWILDATPVPVGNNQYGPPHAAFYRVVGITQSSASLDLEVQPPLRDFPLGQQSSGLIFVLDGVAEVFEKGTGWKP